MHLKYLYFISANCLLLGDILKEKKSEFQKFFNDIVDKKILTSKIKFLDYFEKKFQKRIGEICKEQ